MISGLPDKRIGYLKEHNNGVIGVFRNVGIKIAKGEWIAFLDSDDFWQSNKLEEFNAKIKNNVDVFLSRT